MKNILVYLVLIISCCLFPSSLLAKSATSDDSKPIAKWAISYSNNYGNSTWYVPQISGTQQLQPFAYNGRPSGGVISQGVGYIEYTDNTEGGTKSFKATTIGGASFPVEAVACSYTGTIYLDSNTLVGQVTCNHDTPMDFTGSIYY